MPCAPDASYRLCVLFETIEGVDTVVDRAIAPLAAVSRDLARCASIVIAGAAPEGVDWVDRSGPHVNSLRSTWKDFPPSGHMERMAFHESFRFKDGRTTALEALWDLPEGIMQAGEHPSGAAIWTFATGIEARS